MILVTNENTRTIMWIYNVRKGRTLKKQQRWKYGASKLKSDVSSAT